MKFVVALLVLGLAVNAHALFNMNRATLQSLMFRQMSLTCKCKDKFRYCEYMKNKCGSHMMNWMCQASCGMCTPCAPTTPPRLAASLSPCEMDCVDVYNKAVCEYFKDEGRCNVFKNKCRATCGECRMCDLPPNVPDPCTEDCKDTHDQKSCTFWESKELCDNKDVKYVCQRTCKACTLCPPKTNPVRN